MRAAFVIAGLLLASCQAAPAGDSAASEPIPAAPGPAAPASRDELLALVPADAVAGRGEVGSELSGELVGTSVLLAREVEIAGIPCAGGEHSPVSVWIDSWGCSLARDHELDGHTSRAGTYLAVHYRTGRRAGAVLEDLLPPAASLNIGGVECETFAHFHPDGALLACPLAADHAFGSVRLRAGSDVVLRADGSLEDAVIYERHEIAGAVYAPGTIELDASGVVIAHHAGWFGE